MPQQLAHKLIRRLDAIARQIHSEEEGVNLVIISLLMVTLLGFAGISIDGSGIL